MIRITGMNSGLDTDAMVQELVNAYDKKTETYKGDQKKLQWKQDAWKELNNKVKNFVSKSLNNMRFSTNYSKKKTVSSNESIASVVTSDNAVNGRQTLKVTGLAQSGYLTSGKLVKAGDASSEKVKSSTKLSELGYTTSEGEDAGKITLTKGDGSTKTFDVNGDMTVGEFVKTVKAAGVNASFDENTGRIYISANDTGSANDFTLSGDANALSALQLNPSKDAEGNGIAGGTATKIYGSDATIELNGVSYTSGTNTFSINGLTITAKEVSDQEISLTTETDYDSIYDNIKSFIKEYNSLVNQMDTLYNAESADDYKMLTDEEKDAMSEKEVEEWEDKIKSALMRRDSNLSSISSTLRNAMLETYDVDGKTYSLSSFGISTLSYFLAADNEKNAYHIDGDPDDAETSGEKDKLKAAIASDPETVSKFFQKLATNMYDQMSKLSSSNSYRSFGNYYDDKKLKKEYDEWTTKISDYESYVADVEERYYKQFTQMEKAMGQMQSQQTYISQLMG